MLTPTVPGTDRLSLRDEDLAQNREVIARLSASEQDSNRQISYNSLT